tara:strand:- start:382 stop:579 length:198 start_codon:yes stop_codon:yes gene_type:complete
MRKSSLIVIDGLEAQALVEYIRNPHSASHDEAIRAVVEQFIDDIGTGTAREISIHTHELREADDE